MPDGCHGTFPPAPPHTTISQHAAQQVYVVQTREYYCFYYVFISYFKAQHIINVPCLSVCGLSGAESIILSVGSAETIILSAGGTESMMLSVCSESMIVSAPPAASMILSACLIVLLRYYHANSGAVGGNKRTTISNTDNCRLTTLVNSVSTALPIGLLPKTVKFCCTFNRLLVGR